MKNIDTSFFNISTENLPVTAGCLLIAEPFLTEMWFDRSVITVIDHNMDEGTSGVVLNQPIESTLDEVLDGVNPDTHVHVYCGGPLSQDRLFFVHTLGDAIIPDAREYAPGLWIGGDFNAAVDYVNGGYPVEGFLRFFVGYSGWGRNQVEKEIEMDTWAVQPRAAAIGNILEGSGDAYWHNAVRSLGERYRSWQLLPHDLTVN